MIQDHRSSISFKRTLYHDSRVNLRPVNRSLEHLLETQHAMPVMAYGEQRNRELS